MMDILTNKRRQSVYERDHVQSLLNKYGVCQDGQEVDTKNDPLKKVQRKFQKMKQSIPRSNNMKAPPAPEAVNESDNDGDFEHVNDDLPSRQEIEEEIENDLKASEITPPSSQEEIQEDDIHVDNSGDVEMSYKDALSENSVNKTKLPDVDMSEFVSKADLVSAVTEAMQSQKASAQIDVNSAVTLATTQLRTEMKQDREKMESKLEDVSGSIATEITKATEPFTAVLQAMQTSQQQFFSMFQQNFAQVQYRPPLLQLPPIPLNPILSAPLVATSSQVPQPPIKIEDPSTTMTHRKDASLAGKPSQINKTPDPAIRFPNVKVEPGAKI